MTQIEHNCGALIDKAKANVLQKFHCFDASEYQRLKADVEALLYGHGSSADRIRSLEEDIRDDDGLLMSLIHEVRSQAAAGATGSFTAGD